MVEKLKGKTLDYTQGGTPQPPETTQPPSGSIDSRLVGYWKHSYPYSDIYGNWFTQNTYYNFYSDGTFKSWDSRAGRYLIGKYTTTGGKVHFSISSGYVLTMGGYMREDDRLDIYDNSVFEYECSTDDDGNYLKIAYLGYQAGEKALSNGDKFRVTTATELDNLIEILFSN